MVLTRFQRRLRVFIKRFLYSQLYLRDSLLILLGRAKPLVRFTVEATPPSVYLNFAIRPERLEAYERELALPYPLTPIRCLEGDEPFHCLTLNVYRVSGLANGFRAEWSAYVEQGGKPRYLVVEAVGDQGALDPDRLITRGGLVRYAEGSDGYSIVVGSEGGTRFEAQFPACEDGPRVRAAPEWVEANDYIYWRSGVCDRTFYDSGLANARARAIDVAKVSIQDGTHWSEFVDPTPRHVIAFEDAIEFAMSPWWNLDELRDPD